MSRKAAPFSPLIEWAVANRVRQGQSVLGDWYAVQPFTGGVVLAAIDGLGHGEGAAEAARITADLVKLHAQESIISLLQRCHEGLRGTRGAVMSVGVFNSDDSTLTWTGMGDVAGTLLRRKVKEGPEREHLVRRAGVLGLRIPRPSASIISVFPGELLIFATDGVRSDFWEGLSACEDPPQKIADRILARYAHESDDALVLVARYLGSGPTQASQVE